MSYGNIQGALSQYRKVGVQGSIMDASPHRLIQMLMEGALERLHTAKGCMQRGEVAAKGKYIGGAISIIDGLRASLDMEAGGAMAENLEALYDYMNRRLLEANMQNRDEIIDEVSRLMLEVKSGWDAIPESVKNAHAGESVRVGNGV